MEIVKTIMPRFQNGVGTITYEKFLEELTPKSYNGLNMVNE